MTNDAEFGAAEYNVTASEVDGVYQTPWAEGKPVNMAFTSITADGTTAAYTYGDNFADPDADYIVRYFNDVNNDKEFKAEETQVGNGETAPTEVGNYWMVAITESANAAWTTATGWTWNRADGLADAQGELAPGVIAVYFKVTARSIEGVTAIDGTTGASEFTYDGDAQDVDFALNGKVLNRGIDYEVTVTDPAGDQIGIAGIKNAGTYNAKVTGKGGYEGSNQDVTITVAKLDLSTADIFAADVKANDSVAGYDDSYVNGTKLSTLIVDRNGNEDIAQTQVSYTDMYGETHAKESGETEFVSWPSNTNVSKGGYTFRLTAASDNVTGSNEYTINAVENLVTDFRYGQLASADGIAGNIDELPPQFNLSKDDPFDPAEVRAYDGTTDKALAADAYTVVPESATAPGDYTAVAQVKYAEPNNYSIGGTGIQNFTVINGILDPKSVDVAVSFYGKNYDFTNDANHTYEAQYTGAAVDPVIRVSCEGTALAEGEGYEVSYATVEGQAVESMVESGLYKVTIDLADGYAFDNGATSLEFWVEIFPRVFSQIVVDQPDRDEAYGWGILYTGSEIAPVVKGTYLRADAAVNAAGEYTDEDYETVTLDPSWYELHGLSYKAEGAETFSPVDEVLEAGEYMVNVVPTAACANYDWADNAQTVTFRVIAKSAFSDVAADAWYADEVNAAYQNGYVNGMGNNLFVPDADMTRAQFAQVVYNMAGEPEGAVNQNGTYPTQFDDVIPNAWYAKAVSWAVEAGVVNGTSETTFDPEGKITREQIATMLYRYAGNGAAADATALDAFVDGDEVSAWAETAMAWAVEEGYMEGKGANDLQPQATATRAEVAALSVRVQPEVLPRF